MNPKRALLALPIIALMGMPAAAQLSLPSSALPPLPRLPDEVGVHLNEATNATRNATGRLLLLRDLRISRLLRQNFLQIERDAQGELARKGVLLLVDPSPGQLAVAQEAGFTETGREELVSLGLSVVRLALPQGMPLAEGESQLGRLMPGTEIAPDNLHFQSGSAAGADGPALSSLTATMAPIGVIDGGPVQKVSALRGFASGAPLASDHGSAVVSLLAGAGATDVRVADIFGTDRAGGNALALVRGLNWLVAGGSKVVSISLAGPPNAVVAKAVAAARGKGVVLVAAVGNDGPAAPPAYPASYPGVLAVTGVDARNRPLIEAGRSLHLDYAAPGAGMLAANRVDKWVKVRGTSFAAPLVAARAAAAVARGAAVLTTLDAEAQDLGTKGADPQFGRGLLCRTCARGR